jgi:ribonucleotide monophosphatase NagD (HAD superfamily)
MAAILLDVDGVLHVSGEPIGGAAGAVRELREAGHRLRFVTNNTTRSRTQLVSDLRGLGFVLEEEELQTTPAAAARVLRGKRALVLTMAAIVEDLQGVELVGEGADAVLIGGADETPETGRVF